MRVLLVEDGESPTALVAARALHAAGWEVGVATARRDALAPVSRAVRAKYRVPPPTGSLTEFVAGVRAAVEKGGYEVVLGAGDAEVLALSAARDELGGAVVPYAEHELVLRAFDKESLADAATAAGMRVPRAALATEARPEDFAGPVVVKARLHWEPGTVKARRPVRAFPDLAAALPYASELAATGAAPFVQERLAGALMAYVSVSDRDGRIVAEVQQRAGRIYPPGAGNSARAVTEPVDPELAAAAQRLLKDLGWFGLAQLEFVRCGDGPAYLIDFNGRLYGSLALGVAAGVNLPAIWAAVATGRPAEATVTAPAGVRYQRLEDDLRRALVERRGGLLHDVIDTLAAARGAAHAVWSPGDPRPAVRRSLKLARLAAAKLKS